MERPSAGQAYIHRSTNRDKSDSHFSEAFGRLDDDGIGGL